MKIEDLSFEEALSKLEEVVKELEKEDITLEDSMERFEKEIKLSSHCLQKLNEAEIRQLLADGEKVDYASCCPHGRPTAISFSLDQLEKQFKRK